MVKNGCNRNFMNEINKKFSKVLIVIGFYFLIAFLIKLVIDSQINNEVLNFLSLFYLFVGILFVIGFFVVRYFLKIEVKRYLLWIVIFAFLVLILFPFKNTYFDGGSVEYNSLIYKVIKWHRVNENYENGYKIGKEVHLFPYNFFSIDYYDEIEPEILFISSDNQKISASLNSYCYISNINNLSRESCVDYPYKVSEKYDNKLKINKNDKIEFSIKFDKVNNIKVYSFNDSEEWYKKPVLVKNANVNYEKESNILNVSLEKGEYVISLFTYFDDNEVMYTFMVSVFE